MIDADEIAADMIAQAAADDPELAEMLVRARAAMLEKKRRRRALAAANAALIEAKRNQGS